MSQQTLNPVHQVAYDPEQIEELPVGTVISARLPTGRHVCGVLRHTQDENYLDAAYMPLLIPGCSEVTVQVPRCPSDVRCTQPECPICHSARLTALAAGEYRQQPASTPVGDWEHVVYRWTGLSAPLGFTNTPEGTRYAAGTI